MQNYEKKVCTACVANAPRATQSQTDTFLEEYKEWELIIMEEIPRLDRTYPFKNYIHALDFLSKVANIAEQEGHHPAILFEWGKVKVSWWTHKIKGLHENDFIMASKTDQIYVNFRNTSE
jgi:4a-hydroxytetrahydrobiopterin dehydratase